MVDELHTEVAVALARSGYVVREKLGSGSYAEVRCCRKSNNPGILLAVKIINRSVVPQEFIHKFFPRELMAVQMLHHPNIVRVHQVLEFGQYTCLVMDKAQGGDLLDFIISQGALGDDYAHQLFCEITSALQHCHQHKIAHRDLKCENILLTSTGHALLTDFGFSRSCIDTTTQKRILSRTYCGSTAYAAPEIISGSPYNPMMSDIWSLGVILFIIITGVMPFDDSNRLKLLRYQRQGRWKFPSGLVNKLNPSCKMLVRHLLEPDITRRANLRQILASDWVRQPSSARIQQHEAGASSKADD